MRGLRKESDIPQWEFQEAASILRRIVEKNRRGSKGAANVYHDVIAKGDDAWEDFLDKKFLPIWKYYGYPRVSSGQWSKAEWKFMNDVLDVKNGNWK